MNAQTIDLPQLYQLLYDHLDTNGWWPAVTDWQIIWGAVLIQNTNWKNVDYALADLQQSFLANYQLAPLTKN